MLESQAPMTRVSIFIFAHGCRFSPAVPIAPGKGAAGINLFPPTRLASVAILVFGP